MKKSRAVELLAQKLEWAEDCAESLAMEDEYDRDLHHEWEEEAEALRMAIRALEREGWIPVAERLPEEGGCYLCCWQGKTVDTGFFCNSHFRLYGEIKDHLITAWMPLPEPYGGDNT